MTRTPVNVTVTGVVCNGTITATRTGAAAFPSTIRVGMSFQMRATDDADYSTNKFRGMVKTISNDRKTITFTKAHTSRTGTGTFVNNPGTPSGSRNTNGTRHWYLNGCNHVTFKNMEITGAVSASETAVGDLGQQYPWPVYYGDLEGQHPIEIAGGTYVEVAGCELHEGYGDGVYLGGQTDHAWIHDNNIYRMAREAVSPIGSTNTLGEGNHFHQITHNKMDCEPTSGYVDGLIVRGNIMG